MHHITGRFETIINGEATGWVRDDSLQPVRVSLYVDGRFAVSDLADKPHSDSGSFRFSLTLPPLESGRTYHFEVRYTDIDLSLNNEAMVATPAGDPISLNMPDTVPPSSCGKKNSLPPPSDTSQKPRIAFVLSTREGGIPETNRDLMAALYEIYEPWVITSNSAIIDLYAYHPDGDRHIERTPLQQHVSPQSLESSSYNTVIIDILERYGFSLVHIRHMGWHAYSLPALCKQMNVPVLMSLHDYYTVCPSIKLLDDQNRHCGGQCSDTTGECKVELWPQTEFPKLKNDSVHHWRTRFDEALSHCDGFVTTSETARTILRAAHPSLLQSDFRLIEHGRDFPADTVQNTPWPTNDEPLKILVPGGISPAKGANIINSLIALNTDGALAFHILGNGWYIDKQSPHVFDHGAYQRDDFAMHVKTIRPHIGAVFSIWAETYCHTLTEMWACGLPVAGLNIGAVGERISAQGCGWLFPTDANPSDIYAKLLQIKSSAPEHIFHLLKVWRQSHDTSHTTQQMASAYKQFYADICTTLTAQSLKQ